MSGLDASVLTLLLYPDSDSPFDPATQKPVVRAKDRVELLIADLQKANKKIVIPTPVLSEVLVKTGSSGLQYVKIMQRSEVFDIRSFDQIAAIELAEMTRRAEATGNKREGSVEPYQKIKLDRQIVAICKIAGVQTLYACDRGLRTFAQKAGLKVIGVHELPLPPEPPQLDMLSLLKKEDEAEPQEPNVDEPDEEDEAPDR
jgi:predicted nucleic acid-binding protein